MKIKYQSVIKTRSQEGIKIYKIGEISKKTGLSVRSVRYYDKINLLTPSFKNENGFRYYNDDDLIKLEKITILKILGFTLKEMQKILKSENIADELEHQESLIENKIKYLTLIKKSIGMAKNKMTYEEDLSSLLVELKLIFNGCMKEFHDQSKSERPREKYNKNIHADVMKLLRKIASEDGGTRGDYLKLLKHNPKLKDREYLSKYFTMLRLYKSNKFKLDEIDNLEKNIKRFIKSLDSDIM